MEGERGRETLMCERNIDCFPLAHPQLRTWPTTQACALTRNQTSDLSVHRLALDPLSHTSQGAIGLRDTAVAQLLTEDSPWKRVNFHCPEN